MRTGLPKTILAVALCLTLGLNNTLFAAADADLFANPAAPEWIIDAPVNDELNKGFQNGTEDISSGDVDAIDETENSEDTDVSGNDVSGDDISGNDAVRKTRFDYRSEAVNVVVTLQNQEDLPENAELIVTPVPVTEKIQENLEHAAVESQSAIESVAAFDISFMADGVEVEPGDTVKVQVSIPDVSAGNAASVYHYNEEEDSIQNMNASVTTAGDIIFETPHFSTFVIVNNGDQTVTVRIEHYDLRSKQKIYSDDVRTLVVGTKIMDYKKAVKWDVARVVKVVDNKEVEIADPSEITVTSDILIRVYYSTSEHKISGDVTFYDYVVKPVTKNNGREVDAPQLSINYSENYPAGSSTKKKRISIGTTNQNYSVNQYATLINGKKINNYTEGIGSDAIKTGIITGLSDNYSDVLFAVDEPGLFSDKAVTGKTILEDYKLNFTRTGDTYELSSVLDSTGTAVADNMNQFFPLDKASSNVKDQGYGSKHNYYFGMRYDVIFNIGDYVGPLNYHFSGDDDLWVILDGKKVIMDLGGIHDAIGSTVDFWKYLGGEEGSGVNTEDAKNEVHRLTILYMERGGNLSNCEMNFTIPNVQVLDSANTTTDFTFKKVNTSDEALPGAVFKLQSETDADTVYTAVSAADGSVTFHNIRIGTYTLSETMAPAGYMVDDTIWKVVVETLGEDVVAELYDATGEHLVPEQKIVNYTSQESMIYDKKVSLTDWDERTYQISIDAAAKASSATAGPIDVMLVLDLSGSMNLNSSEDKIGMTKIGVYSNVENELDTSKIYYYQNNMYTSTVSQKMAATYPMKYLEGKWLYWDSGNNRWWPPNRYRSIYSWDSRLSSLKDAVSQFTTSLAEMSPQSQLGISSYDGYKNNGANDTRGRLDKGIAEVGENPTEYFKVINRLFADGGTSPQKGLELAKSQLNGLTDEYDKYVILFSDGAPSTDEDERETKETAEILQNEDYTVITVGLALNNKTKEFMEGLASTMDGKHLAYTTSNGEDLTEIFEEIIGMITENTSIPNITVTDVIDSRFTITKEEESRLREGGASIIKNADGMITVSWANQTVPCHTEGKWNRVINVVAADDFIGGNNVATNVSPDSSITMRDTSLTLPQPTVNVKVRFEALEAEDTIFYGTSVGDIHSAIDEVKEKLFDEKQVTYQSIVMNNQHVDGTFNYQWYRMGETSDEAVDLGNGKYGIAVSDSDVLAEEGEAVYYLKVSYQPKSQGTDESNGNTAKNGVSYEASEENSYAVGTYVIKLIDGELTITKTFDKEYLRNAGYTRAEKELVNAFQSVVYLIERYAADDAECHSEPIETYRAVLSYDSDAQAGGEYSASVKLKGLKAGNYKVIEDTEWSWKYELAEVKDTYENPSDGILYIGSKNNETTKYGTLNGYFGESGTESSAAGYAGIDFMNKLGSLPWYSDTCSVINKFIKKEQ